MHYTRKRADWRHAAAWVVTLILVLFGVSLPGPAQVQTYTEISGTVSDSSGAAIPGVAVTLKLEGTAAPVLWPSVAGRRSFQF